jgi:hypothetical protein
MDRELDIQIAERIMGIAPLDIRAKGSTETVRVWTRQPNLYKDGARSASDLRLWALPDRYTTAPDADYEVLKRVRETWDEPSQFRLGNLLDEVWAARTSLGHRYVPENAVMYEPGDYAKAALAAIGATP